MVLLATSTYDKNTGLLTGQAEGYLAVCMIIGL
jgi:hypothetical protein